MASNARIKVQGRASTAQKIQESFLTCPICYEIYDQPKCLPCLHTFCNHCLGSYIESQGDLGAKRKMGFPCPVCKQFVFVKLWTKPLSEWADDIQKNFLIQNMIESLVPQSQSTSSAPESSSLSSGDTNSASIAPAAAAPPPEPEIHSMTPRHRAVPSASPSNPSSGTSRSIAFPGFHYDIHRRRYVPDDPFSTEYQSTWGVLTSTSSAPQSGSLSSEYIGPTSTAPAASAPPPEPEIDLIGTDPIATPSAPPLNPPPDRSDRSGYQWGALNTGYNQTSVATPVPNIPDVIRPSRSTIDVSPSATTSLTVDNVFRNRSNSSNDLKRQETVVSFIDSRVAWKYVYRRNSYDGNTTYSDVCYLPERNCIVVADYSNNKVVYYKHLFNKLDFPKAVKVDGRPCSIALLDEEKENCVVVNLQNKGVLIFISVPDMEILRKVKTGCDYRSVAVISPDTLLAGSPDRPACIHLIVIGKDYKIKRRYVLVKNDKTWDISSPDHMCVLSPTRFMVSDSGKKSLICFDIVEERGTKQAVKRFSLAPTADRKFRNPGGLFFDKSSQSVYTVDYGNHSVLRIVPGDTLLCETLLTRGDNINRPSSVCLGPRNSLCVVDWEGTISVYEPVPTNRSTHRSRTRVE